MSDLDVYLLNHHINILYASQSQLQNFSVNIDNSSKMAHVNNHLDSSDDFFTDTPPNLQPRRFLNNGASNAIVEVNSLLRQIGQF